MNETIQKLLNEYHNKLVEINNHVAAAEIARQQYGALVSKATAEDTCDYDDAISAAARERNQYDNEAQSIEIHISTRVEKIIRGSELAEFWTAARSLK
jgi:hypothetical protein